MTTGGRDGGGVNVGGRREDLLVRSEAFHKGVTKSTVCLS